jgi:hypothetical protein
MSDEKPGMLMRPVRSQYRKFGEFEQYRIPCRELNPAAPPVSNLRTSQYQEPTLSEIRARIILSFCLTTVSILAACSSGEESNRQPDPARMFERLDTDQDGVISWDEYKDAPSRGGSTEERFQTMDKDQDGFITREEFNEAPRPQRRGSGQGSGGRRGFQ